MAEEEVIILEDNEGGASSSSGPPNSEKKYTVWLLAAIGVMLFILLTILVVWTLTKTKSESSLPKTDRLIEKIKSSKSKSGSAIQSQLEQMIRKANILYTHGDKKEALDLFEQIATFSAAISNYNLGVAQMRQNQYESAIESFKKAIEDGENRCISALDAAVCSLYLNDKKRFEYYIGLAQAYLPESYNSPLYSYLYALVNYYRGNYYEIFSAIAHPSSDAYKNELYRIGSISYIVFNRPKRAIALMEKSKVRPDEYLLMGQMYAAIGECSLASKYLKDAIEKSNQPLKSRKSLVLVDLKNGSTQDAAKLIVELQKDFKGKGLGLYPIATKLSPVIYEIDAAQRRFDAESLLKAPKAYRLIFEFAPFKVFDASQTLRFVQKGNAALYVDEESTAARFLSRSSTLSHVNLLISKAIKLAIDHHIRPANIMLQKALKQYPSHSILHYDLALTYAQIGNFSKAYRHFLRSYHLDASNYLSGIFALMCADLIKMPIPKVAHFIGDDIGQMINPTIPQKLLQTLFYLQQGNIAAASKWLSTPHGKRPIYLVADMIIGSALGDWKKVEKSADTLRMEANNNLLAHLLYIQIKYRDLPVKRFTFEAQHYLKRHSTNLDTLYYGSAFTRENYIALRFITGTLYTLKIRLEEKLLGELEDPAGIIEALGLVDIYLKSYEEAYQLFNQLVDKYGHDDSRTLFLSAVAAVGAKHPANASALLELAKLTDPNNLESRYALGLLYLQQKNYGAAAIQFKKIPNGTFRSNYFDFDITSSQPSD